MKKIILLLALFLVFSCEKENSIEKSILEYVKTNFKEPESYERISVNVIDTVTVGDEIKKEKREYEQTIKEFKKLNDKLLQRAQNSSVEAYIKDNNYQIETYNKKIIERCKDTNSNETKYYSVNHKYRANNSFGANELFNEIVTMDKNYKISESRPSTK